MNKNVLIGTLSLVILLGIALWFSLTERSQVDTVSTVPVTISPDYMTALYEIDGELLKLGNPGIRYIGYETYADFNNDNKEDVAFVVSRERVPGETSFYVVAALNLDAGYEGTNAVFLADNITITSLTNTTGTITATYLRTENSEEEVKNISASNTGLRIITQ